MLVFRRATTRIDTWIVKNNICQEQPPPHRQDEDHLHANPPGSTNSSKDPPWCHTVDGNQKSGNHHLRLVVHPIICRVFWNIPGGCLGFQPSTVGSIFGIYILGCKIMYIDGRIFLEKMLHWILGLPWLIGSVSQILHGMGIFTYIHFLLFMWPCFTFHVGKSHLGLDWYNLHIH